MHILAKCLQFSYSESGVCVIFWSVDYILLIRKFLRGFNFRKNLADAKFGVKIKPLQNVEITLSFTDVVNHALVANLKRGKYVF